MRQTVRLLALFLVVVACTGGGPTETRLQRATYRRVETGALFWHGHRVSPPFQIDVEFWLPETLLGNTYINGLPLTLPESPKNKVSATPAQVLLYAQRDTLRSAARRAALDAREQGRNRLEQQEAYAAALRADTALVDSARVWSEWALVVHWRGENSPDYLTSSPGPSLPRPRFLLAMDLADELERGNLVLIGRGLVSIPKGGSRASWCVAAIDSFQAGLLDTLPWLRDRHVLRDLRRPKPIEALLREGEDD